MRTMKSTPNVEIGGRKHQNTVTTRQFSTLNRMHIIYLLNAICIYAFHRRFTYNFGGKSRCYAIGKVMQSKEMHSERFDCTRRS